MGTNMEPSIVEILYTGDATMSKLWKDAADCVDRADLVQLEIVVANLRKVADVRCIDAAIAKAQGK